MISHANGSAEWHRQERGIKTPEQVRIAELEEANKLLAEALAECSCTLNQFDPFDDFNSLWQLKAEIDIDTVLSRTRAAIDSAIAAQKGEGK